MLNPATVSFNTFIEEGYSELLRSLPSENLGPVDGSFEYYVEIMKKSAFIDPVIIVFIPKTFVGYNLGDEILTFFNNTPEGKERFVKFKFNCSLEKLAGAKKLPRLFLIDRNVFKK